MYFKYQSINKMLANQNLPKLFESLYGPFPPSPLPIIILRFKKPKSTQQPYIMVNDSRLSYKVIISPSINEEQRERLEHNSIFKITKWSMNLENQVIRVEDMSYIDTDTDELVFKWWKPKHEVILLEMEQTMKTLTGTGDNPKPLEAQNNQQPTTINKQTTPILTDKDDQEERKQAVREKIEEKMVEASIYLISREEEIETPLVVTNRIKDTPVYTSSFKKFTQENYIDMMRSLGERGKC